MPRGRLPVLIALSLLGNAFSVPTELRVRRGYENNQLDSDWSGGLDLVAASSENRKVRQDDEAKDNTISEKDATTETEPSKVNLSPSSEDSKTSYPPPSPYNDDDDDSDEDDDFNVTQPSSGGGSSIFSLLKLANALFPGSSSSNVLIRNVIRKLLVRYQDVRNINRRSDPVFNTKYMRRIDTSLNEIDDSYIADLKPPPFQKQEIEESVSDENDTESDEDTSEDDDDEDSDNSQETKEDQYNAAEESIESNEKDGENTSEDDDDEDSDNSQETKEDQDNAAEESMESNEKDGENTSEDDDDDEDNDNSQETKEDQDNSAEESIENNEKDGENTSEDDDDDEDNDNSQETKEDQDNAAEESIENKKKDGEKESKSKQETSNGKDDDDDYSEEPESDGQGGGILGLLSGLSGGENGQSDLGSLLAAVSGIVVNLSGDGVDVNALIASGLGLFVGLLSEGEENPGAVIASYLLTSLDTLTGGGAQNNGAFFGTFLSKLVKGTSAVPEESSNEEGNGMPMADSAGFLISFFMGLLGDLSKGSSAGSSRRR